MNVTCLGDSHRLVAPTNRSDGHRHSGGIACVGASLSRGYDGIGQCVEAMPARVPVHGRTVKWKKKQALIACNRKARRNLLSACMSIKLLNFLTAWNRVRSKARRQ